MVKWISTLSDSGLNLVYLYLFQGKQQVSAATNHLRSSAETACSSHIFISNVLNLQIPLFPKMDTSLLDCLVYRTNLRLSGLSWFPTLT